MLLAVVRTKCSTQLRLAIFFHPLKCWCWFYIHIFIYFYMEDIKEWNNNKILIDTCTYKYFLGIQSPTVFYYSWHKTMEINYFVSHLSHPYTIMNEKHFAKMVVKNKLTSFYRLLPTTEPICTIILKFLILHLCSDKKRQWDSFKVKNKWHQQNQRKGKEIK